MTIIRIDKCERCGGALYVNRDEYGDVEMKCRSCSRPVKDPERIKALMAERTHGLVGTTHRLAHGGRHDKPRRSSPNRGVRDG